MLSFLDLKTDLFRMVGSQSNSARQDILVAVTTAINRAQEDFCLHADWDFLEQLSDRVAIPLSVPYDTGTVTATQDSKTVTGSGTTWTKDMEGQFIKIDNSEAYEIRSFVSTTSLTLAIPFQGDTTSGADYKIMKRFYPLPLNFLRVNARDAKLATPGSNSEVVIAYHRDASFTDPVEVGTPQWFGIVGNTRNNDYYNVGTMTVSTSSQTSSWLMNTGSVPSDSVDREVRIHGESRAYYINSITNGSVFTTYNTYVNPEDQTNTLSDASSYAITPKETSLVGFSSIPSQRYIFWFPYIKRIDDLILDTDISPIVLAGYSNAFLTLCRRKLAEDGRVAMRGDMVTNLIAANERAMSDAWASEQHGHVMKWQGAVKRPNRRQVGPSWIER